MAATPGDRLAVRVDYDFASTICFVAQRCMQRLARPVADLGIELCWSPLDLAELMGWPRGAEVQAARRENALRVARELGVAVRMPRTWADSRRAHAVALCIDPACEPVWRERAFTAIFDQGRPLDDGLLEELLLELSLAPDEAALERAEGELERRTRTAADQEVTGVPNFMLGRWPFGGIQTDDTMLSILGRYARRQRRPS